MAHVIPRIGAAPAWELVPDAATKQKLTAYAHMPIQKIFRVATTLFLVRWRRLAGARELLFPAG